MAYTLTLTAEDIRTIAFVGYRYCWSDALSSLEVGPNVLAEWRAWFLKDEFEADTEGGHSYFPMLSRDCDLYGKLVAFMDSIV